MKDIFKLVKANITTRQAAEYYGLNVQRNGMTLCPFHNDHAPSLKVRYTVLLLWLSGKGRRNRLCKQTFRAFSDSGGAKTRCRFRA